MITRSRKRRAAKFGAASSPDIPPAGTGTAQRGGLDVRALKKTKRARACAPPTPRAAGAKGACADAACRVRLACSRLPAARPGGAGAASGDAERAVAFLCRADGRFEGVRARHGAPATLDRGLAFDGCVRAVVFQQLHPKAARSIVARLKRFLCVEESAPFVPCYFVGRTVSELRLAGLSRNKAEYVLDCAALWHDPDSSLTQAGLERMTDDEVVGTISAMRGYGEWSAQFVMINSLQRSDVFPVGDFALCKGAEIFFGKKMSKPQLLAEFERFRPYRTYASFFMYRLHNNSNPIEVFGKHSSESHQLK